MYQIVSQKFREYYYFNTLLQVQRNVLKAYNLIMMGSLVTELLTLDSTLTGCTVRWGQTVQAFKPNFWKKLT